MKPRLCVDFDGTIFDGHQLTDGCLLAISALREKFKIAIFSARATDAERVQMKAILDQFGVPYDEILDRKPDAAFYIDDKGRQFTNWRTIMAELSR